MKLLKRVKRLFVTEGNKIVAQFEDKIECMNYELNKKQKVYSKLKDELDNIQGKKLKLQNDISMLETAIEKLDRATKKALSEHNEIDARQSFQLMECNKGKLELHRQNLQSIIDIESKIEKQVNILAEVIKDIKLQIETLSIKVNFSKTVKDVNKALNVNLQDLGIDELDKLKDDIDLDYFISQVKSDNIESYGDEYMKKYDTQSSFEEYKQSIK